MFLLGYHCGWYRNCQLRHWRSAQESDVSVDAGCTDPKRRTRTQMRNVSCAGLTNVCAEQKFLTSLKGGLG